MAEKYAENVEPIDEDAVEEVVAEEAINPKKDSTNSATNEIRATTHGIMKDEFCSIKSFEIANDEKLIEKILVTANCQGDWSDSVVTKLLEEKLNTIGISMKSIKVNRNVRKCFGFESCLVTIKPRVN